MLRLEIKRSCLKSLTVSRVGNSVVLNARHGNVIHKSNRLCFRTQTLYTFCGKWRPHSNIGKKAYLEAAIQTGVGKNGTMTP